MRILDTLRMKRYADSVTASLSTVTDPSTLPIASPWSTSTLQRIVAEDVFGSELPINTRAAAMRIPTVARARNLIVGTVCRLPLVQLGRGERIPAVDDLAAREAFDAAQPTWLYRTDDGTSPQLRLAWTVDDLLFYGWSCWWRTNREDGFPLAAGRINMGDWSVNADNVVEVNGVPQPPDRVLLIPGLHEGLLTYGVDALEDARQLYRNVRKRLNMPTPGLDLHQTGGRELTETEIDDLIDRWAIARRGDNGGVSYTSKDIEAKPIGGDDGQLMIDARNAAAVDLARAVGVSAGMVDATAPKASLNYETQTGRNQEFVDLDLYLYMTPITARLSLDDLMPRGKRAAFDLTDFTAPAPSPAGPTVQD